MSDVAVQTNGTAPRSKVLVGGLVLVLALAMFGAAFVYAGGIDIVSKLVGGATQTASNTTPPATKPSTTPPVAPAAGAIPSASLESLSKYMYLEQIESAVNIKKLEAGDISSFKITSVKTETDRTLVNIVAVFKDGTQGPGFIGLKQDSGTYYVFDIAGMRPAATGGLADTVALAGGEPANETIEQLMSRWGVKTFDQGVLDTLLSEQKANQAIVKGILDGTYNACAIGAPKAGAGTTTLEIELTGKSSAKAQVTIIKKTIDGKERIFITSFKKL